MNVRIAIYKFQEAKEVIQRMPLVHLIFLMLLMPWMLPEWTAEGHSVICIASGICLAVINFLFDLDNVKYQWLSGLIYITLLGVELVLLEPLSVNLGRSNAILSKGVLFELLAELLPWIYLGARLIFMLPFFTFYKRGRRLTGEQLS